MVSVTSLLLLDLSLCVCLFVCPVSIKVLGEWKTIENTFAVFTKEVQL